jgi:hypothetical protein
MPRREWTAPASAPVVAAFDEPETSRAALTYAFAAADRTGRALMILHCVPPAAARRWTVPARKSASAGCTRTSP